MKKAWENVIYMCSTMLLFEDKASIDSWCKRHHIEKGDVQPIEKYGDHLSPCSKKWTIKEAQSIFHELQLSGEIWQLQESDMRF